MSTQPPPVIWKHIGLHGHSVGTFICEGNTNNSNSSTNPRIVWKSALTGGGGGGKDDTDQTGTTKVLPATALKVALWTVFGKSGYVRFQMKPPTDNYTKSNNWKHEYRFDGFPTSDYDLLQQTLQTYYNIPLKVHHMSSAGTQYGLTSLQHKHLIYQHCSLEEINEEGQEFEEPRAEEEMLSLDLTQVSQVRICI
jgi:hypothetical protein